MLHILVELAPCHTIYHFVSALIYSCIRMAAPPPPSSGFPLVAALGVLRCEALPALLRLALAPSRNEAVRRVDDPMAPVPTLLSRRMP